MKASSESSVAGVEQREARFSQDLELKRSRQLQLINQIARSLLSLSSPEALLAEAVRRLCEALGDAHVQIYLMDESTGALVLKGTSQQREGETERGREGETERRRDREKERRRDGESPSLPRPPVPSLSPSISPSLHPSISPSELNVPIKLGDRVVGMLNVQSERPGDLSEEEVTALEIVADHLAVGLANAHLYAEVQRQVDQLKQSEQWYRAMIENARDAAVIIQQNQFCYVNPRMTQLLGYSKEELYQMESFLDVVADSSRDLVVRNYQQQLAGADISPYEVVTTRKDGSQVVLEVIGSLIEYEGRPAVQATLRDVTEQRRLREQLLQSEKMAAIGQLISGVAHELNNPLTGILGFSELVLMEHELSDGIRRDLETIASEAQRARKIVQNLLAFARSQNAEKSPVNINDLLDLTVRLKDYELRMNNIEVIRQYDPTLPPVMADADQLKQVFLNIIINAEQAMLGAHGRGKLTITTGVKRCLRSGTQTDCIAVRISDDGPGIPQDKLRQIFNPFYTTKEVGTGLGLAISYSIIEDHQGKIYAESSEEQGTTFVIELPILTDKMMNDER
jgi:two-component system NtrC family sensor kinase